MNLVTSPFDFKLFVYKFMYGSIYFKIKYENQSIKYFNF